MKLVSSSWTLDCKQSCCSVVAAPPGGEPVAVDGWRCCILYDGPKPKRGSALWENAGTLKTGCSAAEVRSHTQGVTAVTVQLAAPACNVFLLCVCVCVFYNRIMGRL